MRFTISKRLPAWWQGMRHAVTKHSYVALVITLVLVGMLVEAIRAGWGWQAVVVLLVVLAAIATNLLASVIDRWVHHRVSPREAHTQYLKSLINHCKLLPLAALGGEEGIDRGPTLDDLYIDLNTTSQVRRDRSERQRQENEQRTFLERGSETELLAAKEALAQTPWLVLLGGPGSGKSTFVREVLAKQAEAMLTGFGGLSGLSRDLLPILITLRDLVSRLSRLDLAVSYEERRQRLARAVCDQAVQDLPEEIASFADGLHQALTTGRCMLVLDGLDEVPSEPSSLRQRVKDAVAAVIETYRPERMIVTCRVRSYVGDTMLPDFQAHTLADFDDEQIKTFAERWYTAQHNLGRVNANQAETRGADLTRAALDKHSRHLAGNPMLLTTMAIIHQRETRLPKERVRLYHQAVELLAWRWQERKGGDAALTADSTLAAILTDPLRLRPIVEGLAYKIHDEQQHGRAADGLPRGDALVFLDQPAYLGDVGPAKAFLNYIDERAGLLMGQGGASGKPDTYNFPHRTFQEYLAGCYLMEQRSNGRLVTECADRGNFWSEAVRFGAEELLYNRRNVHTLLDLAYTLCPHDSPSTLQAQRTALWSGLMAALVGREAIERDTGPGGGAPYLERLRRCLLHLLTSNLSPAERVDAGNTLAALGDPRFHGQEFWYLPQDDMLGFVEIPAGTFRMGSAADDDSAFDDEKEEHDVDLPTYYIARYPVTVAQFRAFVEAQPEYRWESASRSQGPWNHPVVWVSWHDAIAYCKWLTARLRERWDDLPERLQKASGCMQWQITLPSEAEWEKAARWTDGRGYPWGNNPDPNRANYGETGIDTTSAVGCFPGGTSPYGIEDMSGNVWEWTRSLWGEDWQKPTFIYPYRLGDDREKLDAPDSVLRVLRGGAFWSHHRYVRCAYRLGYDPRRVHGDVGFRLVVAVRP